MNEHWKCEDCGDSVPNGCWQCGACLDVYRKSREAISAKTIGWTMRELQDIVKMRGDGYNYIDAHYAGASIAPSHLRNSGGGRRVIRKGFSP